MQIMQMKYEMNTIQKYECYDDFEETFWYIYFPYAYAEM